MKAFGKNLTWLVIAGSALGAGCNNQNPFPQGGTLSETPAKTPEAVLPPYSLEPNLVMEFVEGQAKEFVIPARVSDGGTPVIRAYDLPDGAVFNPKTQKLSWTPSMTAGDDTNDLSQLIHRYPVRFVLMSSKSNKTTVERQVMLVVHNVVRPLQLRMDSSAIEMSEGTDLSATVQVVSPDFPKGPFDLKAKGLPDGAAIEASTDDPTQFTLRYSPGFSGATSDDSSDDKGYYKDLSFDLTAVGPRAQQVTQTVKVRVRDVRQEPVITAPDQLEVGTDANFTVTAEDPNGEQTPDISVVSETPAGRISMDPALRRPGQRGRSNPWATFAVTWDQIPIASMHKSMPLTVKACARDQQSGEPNCSLKTINVTFSGQLHPAPVIDRTEWMVGSIRYLREQDQLDLGLGVAPARGEEPDATVEIFPEAVRSEVSWREGRLWLAPTAVGFKQFSVVATSPFGPSTSESFNLEVFPKAWSPTVILGERLADSEIKSLSAWLPGSQVINPQLQALDDRMMALRGTLVIGTNAMALGADLKSLRAAMGKVRNVVIATPLLEQFGNPLPAGVTLKKRFLDVPGHGDLAASSVSVAANLGLPAPGKPYKLGQALSAESKSPTILSVVAGGSCQPLLNLDLGFADVPVAVVCDRPEGGKLILSGVEWSDLVADATSPSKDQDQQLPSQWLSQLLAEGKKKK